MNSAVDTKELYAEVYKADGHNYARENANTNERPSEQLKVITQYIKEYELPNHSVVVEVGCGLGHLNICHPNWKGFEYSRTAIDLAKKKYGDSLNIVEADARKLPLDSNSVDLLFSFAALEHIPEIEKVFGEVERVLKPNGIAVLSPAWNCRSWTVKKLQQRPYSELRVSEKLGKFFIPVRNSLIFRILCSIPSRLSREIYLVSVKQPIKLQYRKLEPDFSLWNRYEHISDDDAFVSIDAHAALVYFASRKWDCDSHPTFSSRFGCRGEEIVVKKPV